MGQGGYLMERKEFFNNESFLETIPPNNEPYIKERWVFETIPCLGMENFRKCILVNLVLGKTYKSSKNVYQYDKEEEIQ
jgi:hypothetical protein